MRKTRKLQYSSSGKLLFILQKIAALKRNQINIPRSLVLLVFFNLSFWEMKKSLAIQIHHISSYHSAQATANVPTNIEANHRQ